MPDDERQSAEGGPEEIVSASLAGARAKPLTSQEVQNWLVMRIASLMNVEPREIDIKSPFTAFGLTSREAVSLSGELENWLHVELSPTIAYEYPTIELISSHLAPQLEVGGSDAGKESARPGPEPIAIIGIGCRFPGAASVESFWQSLRDGVDAVTEVPAARWDRDAFYDATPGTKGKMCTRWGGFLDQVDEFDPEFFRISPREAARMDPQQRLLLEVAWEALEDAGLAPTRLGGTQTGVFIGISSVDYTQIQFLYDDPAHFIDAYSGTGVAHSIAANRLSYLLDLRGPSMAIDTACSSSLVAVHLACQSLRNGESEVALAGGVNVILSPEINVGFSLARMLSPDGRCKSFDASADGYVRGEGCGVVVLKRLSGALRDGDRVLAVVRGSAVNQDGRTNGLTAPNALAQQAVIQQALRDAMITAAQLSYIEAHGTGTTLGDYIEFKTLSTVLAGERTNGRKCLVGSVKANLGHLEAAAGMAGLIKIVLCLQNEAVPPQLHLKTVNPRISLDESPIIIPTELTAWPAGQSPRRAGINSFGFGGTNAHLILEEAPVQRHLPPGETERPLHLLALSAKSKNALQELSRRFVSHLAADTSHSLADICYSANTGRAVFEHRLAVTASSEVQLGERLSAFAEGRATANLLYERARGQRPPKVAFLFTGQGAQFPGMGRELYETAPLFRRTFDKCAELLRPYLEQPLEDVIYAAGNEATTLNETAYTQPALFALEYALAELWQSWGIKPAAVMGHSLGEYVAACVAGVFTLEEGIKLVAERARLMQALPPGGMMAAVLAAKAEVSATLKRCGAPVSIAADNGPQSVVISGERDAIEEVIEILSDAGISTHPLTVSHAFHSRLMEPMIDAFEQVTRQVNFRPPQIPLVLNLTGQLPGSGLAPDAAYWSRHLRETVQFAPGMNALEAEGCGVFLELGPHSTLLDLGKRCLSANQQTLWLPSLRRGKSDWLTLLESLGSMFIQGAEVNWENFDLGYGRKRVALPTYPFERKKYWLDPDPRNLSGASNSRQRGLLPTARRHSLLGNRLGGAQPLFESQLSLKSHKYLSDHRVQGAVVLPGAAYIELALEAAVESYGEASLNLREVVFEKALFLSAEETRTLQVSLAPADSETNSFRIYSAAEGMEHTPDQWTMHAAGIIRRAPATNDSSGPDKFDLEAIKASCPEIIEAEDFYSALEQGGLQYGSSFRGVERIWSGKREALGQVRAPQEIGAQVERHYLHPVILDSCFQVLAAAVSNHQPGEAGQKLFLPISVESVRVYARPRTRLWSYARLRSATSDNHLIGDIQLLDEDGQLIADLNGFRLQSLSQESSVERIDDWLYQVAWQEQPLGAAESKQAIDEGTVAPGSWLILADREGIGEQLSTLLRTRGESCVLVFEGEKFAAAGEALFRLNSARPAEMQRLLAETSVSTAGYRGIIHLWGLNATPLTEVMPVEFDVAQSSGCVSVLHLVQALAEARLSKPPRLWLVTRGMQAAGPGLQGLSLTQAPLSGLARTLAQEHPELRCTSLDLSLEAPPETVALVEEVLADGPEDQIALRGSLRLVARLTRLKTETREEPAAIPGEPQKLSVPDSGPFRLEIPTPGVLDNLKLRSAARRPPDSGEVEIRVHATGVNFRDVMKTLGIYPSAPGDPLWLGDECAGRISALGAGVEGLRVGDEVVAVAPLSFGTFATTRAEFVAAKPPGVSFTAAATIPIAFLTAYYALHDLARLRKGERVLIHTAAGGVGQAAVQIAQLLGAEIYATAGSPEKREFLRSLGIEHVMDSRSLAFADQVLEMTNYQGVDVILNSLAGEAISKNLSILGDYGRFLEIGKRDIYENRKLEMRPFQKNLSFFAIDMDRLMRQRPLAAGSLMREIMQHFKEGVFHPLPFSEFPIEDTVAAFRFMAQGKNVGKVIVSQPDKEGEPVATGRESEDFAAPAFDIRADGTYLITGGLGGLGLQVAHWLIRRGARHLALMSRSGDSAVAQTALEEMKAAGAQVRVARGDVADSRQVASVLAEIKERMPQLCGIIHAAGVLDDGILLQLNHERFNTVMRPKVIGAWNLHALTAGQPLDFFILFSSVASLLGSPGQGNYSAANSFLDLLAHYRRQRGQAAISINWGPWAEVGMAARTDPAGRLAQRGLRGISVENGLRALEQLLFHPTPQVSVISVSPQQLRLMPWLTKAPLLNILTQEGAAASLNVEGRPDQESLSRAVLLIMEPAERQQVLEQFISKEIARSLGIKPQHLNTQTPLNSLGLDSLSAIELKNRIENDLGVDVPMVTFIQGVNISSLALQILDLLGDSFKFTGAMPSEAPAASPVYEAVSDDKTAAELLSRLPELSDQQVSELLNDMLVEPHRQTLEGNNEP